RHAPERYNRRVFHDDRRGNQARAGTRSVVPGLYVAAPGDRVGVVMSDPMSRTGRLLIVDDDEGVTQTFAGILRLDGHQVRIAMNANDGLREAVEFRPDAIILDLRMPLINGLGFLYRLRERDEHVPVTIITGDASLTEEAMTELEDLGADVCFKPIWTEDRQAPADRLLSRPLAARARRTGRDRAAERHQPPHPRHSRQDDNRGRERREVEWIDAEQRPRDRLPDCTCGG